MTIWIGRWRMNTLVTSQYQPRLSSITKIFSRRISQSDCSFQIKLNYFSITQRILSISESLLSYTSSKNHHAYLICKSYCDQLRQKNVAYLETEITPGFYWGSCYSIFSFICMFCRSLFVLLSPFFWPLCCLFFFNIRILIATLISPNSSWDIVL